MSKRKIVVSLITREQEFQRLQEEDARRSAKIAGYDIEVVFADGNSLQQIDQLFKIIHAPKSERPAAIIIEPVAGDAYARVARNAVKAGIGWVLINARVDYLDRLRNEYPHLPLSLVMTDQVEVGRIQARQFRALLPGGGVLLYVQGPTGTTPVSDRLSGMQEGIEGAGFEVKRLTADWTEIGGEKAVEAWLQLPINDDIRPDIVGCQNDSLAVGAGRALRTHRPDCANLPFTGCDGLADGGQLLVNTGRLAATVVNPSNTGPAIELVTRFLERQEPVPPVEMLKPRSYPEIEALTARRRL